MQTLKSDEYSSPHYRDEVQRQIHQVSDDGLGAKALERASENLAQLGNGVTPRLKLPTLSNKVGSISGHQGPVKGVKQGVLEDPGTGDHGDDGRALVQDEEDGGQECDGTVHENHDGQLRKVGQRKHACHHAHA